MALERGSSIYGGLSAGAMVPGTTSRPGETVQLDINGRTMGQAVVDASGRWSIPAPPSLGPAQGAGVRVSLPRHACRHSTLGWSGCGIRPTMWQAPLRACSGGSAAVPSRSASVVSRSAAQQVEMQSRNLVRALQQNPRYAEGERKSIEKDIQIGPEALSNPTAYRLRLVEIGKYIQEELQFQASVLKNPNGSTVQQRQQAPAVHGNAQRVLRQTRVAATGQVGRGGQKLPQAPSSLMKLDSAPSAGRTVMAGDTYDATGFAPVSPEAAARLTPYEAAGVLTPRASQAHGCRQSSRRGCRRRVP